MQIILICLKIFLARIIDVSIGVIRTVELVKDNTFKAVLFAFFEVFIWFLIAKEALTTNELNMLIAFFYSLGYACGTLIGSYLTKILVKGSVSVFTISSRFKNNNITYLKQLGYGITKIDINKNKKLLFIEVNKKKVNNLIKKLKEIDDNAFITVSDTKYIVNGYVK